MATRGGNGPRNAAIASDYSKGLSLGELSVKYGLHKSGLSRIVKAQGVPARSAGRRPGDPSNDGHHNKRKEGKNNDG